MGFFPLFLSCGGIRLLREVSALERRMLYCQLNANIRQSAQIEKMNFVEDILSLNLNVC